MIQGSVQLDEDTKKRLIVFHGRIKQIKALNTADAYTRGAKLLELFMAESGVSLARATPGLLDDFVQWLASKGMVATGIKLTVIGARQYIGWRRKSGEPIPEIELPDVPTKKGWGEERVVLDPHSLARYLGTVCRYKDPLRTVMLLLPMSGLRAEEITSLEMDCIVTRPDIPLALNVLGKGSKPRIVPIGRQGRKILSAYLSTWRSNTRPDVNWIFPGQGTEPIRNRSLRKAIDWVAKRMGIPHLHPHALRRTYITYLADRGVPTMMIAKLVGHGRLDDGTPQVTMKYYSSDLVTMAKVIEQISFPAPILSPEAA